MLALWNSHGMAVLSRSIILYLQFEPSSGIKLPSRSRVKSIFVNAIQLATDSVQPQSRIACFWMAAVTLRRSATVLGVSYEVSGFKVSHRNTSPLLWLLLIFLKMKSVGVLLRLV